MGPRVATLCFLHSLAARCGVLPGNQRGGDNGPGEGAAAVYEDPKDVEAGTAAGHAIWRHLFDISKGAGADAAASHRLVVGLMVA